MATTWLITREDEEERENSIRVPCVETKLLPWPWLTENVAPVPLSPAGERAYQFTFFTSRRAVASWRHSRSELAEVAALSPTTSEVLEAEGIKPLVTCAGGVVALAEKLLAWWTAKGSPKTHIRYPTSEHGLRSPEQAEALRLLAQLGEIDRRMAYAITAPAGLRESLERSARGDWAISFASPSAVEHFFASGAVLEQPPVRVACLGASTERSWNSARPNGWPQAVNTRVSSPPTTEVTP